MHVVADEDSSVTSFDFDLDEDNDLFWLNPWIDETSTDESDLAPPELGFAELQRDESTANAKEAPIVDNKEQPSKSLLMYEDLDNAFENGNGLDKETAKKDTLEELVGENLKRDQARFLSHKKTSKTKMPRCAYTGYIIYLNTRRIERILSSAYNEQWQFLDSRHYLLYCYGEE
jgi:hypothetical protein